VPSRALVVYELERRACLTWCPGQDSRAAAGPRAVAPKSGKPP
jgi:hypothetical protein